MVERGTGRIVFVSNRQGQSDVWTMLRDGRQQRPVARRLHSDDWNPRLSGDAALGTQRGGRRPADGQRRVQPVVPAADARAAYLGGLISSDYERYGDTCAGRQEAHTGVLCAVAFPG